MGPIDCGCRGELYAERAARKALTKAEIESYIRMFDQRKHLLLVIVEKTSEQILGYFRVDIDDRGARFLVSMIVSEPDGAVPRLFFRSTRAQDHARHRPFP